MQGQYRPSKGCIGLYNQGFIRAVLDARKSSPAASVQCKGSKKVLQ